MLQVQVAEIPEEGMRIDVGDGSWFPDREFSRRDDLQANVHLARKSGRIMVNGSISVTVAMACDRCLAEFDVPETIDFELAVEPEGTDEALAVAEHECDRNEMDVIYLDEPVIDIGDILYQQVVLALPQKALCRPDCRGICGGCGADLNDQECSCRDEEKDSPFSVLGRLLDKDNK